MRRAAPLHRALWGSPAVFGLLLLLAGGVAHAQGGLTPAARLLDGFDDATLWTASASDQVKAALRQIDASENESDGKALWLDFDFNGVSGYAIARRALPLQFPENYVFGLKVRGEAPPNALQFKLVDASGENVWWFRRSDFAFPRDWRRLEIKKRHIEFAWGPASDRALRRSATLELVVAAGLGGGRGSVCFDQLNLRELPVHVPEASAPKLSATSAPASAGNALDGSMATAWTSDPRSGPEQALVIDFERPREFGGIVLHWQAGHHASRYEVQFSDDGQDWTTVRTVIDGNGGEDALYLPESETRFVRLRMRGGPAGAYGIAEIELKDLAFGATPNAFFQALARQAPRGRYPRGFSGEQSYWTLVGVDGGAATGLISEDGAIEVGKGGFSIEPFLVTASGLVTWADIESQQSLQDGYLPIPSVRWRAQALSLDVTAFASGTRSQSQLFARYTLTNLTDRPQTVTLALAVRPFQVNPPTQFLNTPGGVHPIHTLAWDRDALAVNGERRVFALNTPDAFVASTFDAGSIVDRLGGEALVPVTKLHDPFGYASGALVFKRTLAQRSSETVSLALPLTGVADLARPAQADEWLRLQQYAVAAEWREKLNRFSLRLPEAGKSTIDTLRTALAHMLISRDGPALQPGTRSYARSWIRDGAMMVEGLLRLGHEQVAGDFIRWYAPHQFANGKVPC
ncbi:MAG: discoidin domain-containing protein, partial [Burkholderiales bacterium]